MVALLHFLCMGFQNVTISPLLWPWCVILTQSKHQIPSITQLYKNPTIYINN